MFFQALENFIKLKRNHCCLRYQHQGSANCSLWAKFQLPVFVNEVHKNTDVPTCTNHLWLLSGLSGPGWLAQRLVCWSEILAVWPFAEDVCWPLSYTVEGDKQIKTCSNLKCRAPARFGLWFESLGHMCTTQRGGQNDGLHTGANSGRHKSDTAKPPVFPPELAVMKSTWKAQITLKLA